MGTIDTYGTPDSSVYLNWGTSDTTTTSEYLTSAPLDMARYMLLTKASDSETYTWGRNFYKVNQYASSSVTTDTWRAWGDWADSAYQKVLVPKITPLARMREILASRRAPAFIVPGKQDIYDFGRKALGPPKTDAELRARQTLRRVIGEDKWRLFCRNGFISVTAPSGLVYQVYPAHGVTNVFDMGECVERLCVVLTGQFPPTDSLIMRYLMILNNEDDFRSRANTHTVYKKKAIAPQIDTRPLQLIFAELRNQAVA